MSFDLLPKEVLLKIFSHFSFRDRICIQRVCKTWNDLAFVDVKYVKFCGKYSGDLSYDETGDKRVLNVWSWSQVNKVLRRCTQLTSVKFEWCNFDDNDVFEETAALIAGIRKVGFDLDKSGFELLNILNKYSTKIEEFTLWFDNTSSGSSDALNCFLQRNKSIKVLRMGLDSLSFDFNLLPTLTEFRVYSAQQLPSSLFQSVLVASEETLQKLDLSRGNNYLSEECCVCISRLLNLKELRIQMGFNDLLKFRCQKLERLKINLMEVGEVDDHHVSQLFKFLKHNPRLSVLNLSNYGGLRNMFIENLCICCPELKCLCLNNFEPLNEKHLESLLKLRKLENIDLRRVIASSSQTAEFMLNSQSLRFVDVHFYGEFDECDALEVLTSFVIKARLNTRQTFYLNIHEFKNYPLLDDLKNFYWMCDKKSNDHRQLSTSEWHFIVRKPRLQFND